MVRRTEYLVRCCAPREGLGLNTKLCQCSLSSSGSGFSYSVGRPKNIKSAWQPLVNQGEWSMTLLLPFPIPRSDTANFKQFVSPRKDSVLVFSTYLTHSHSTLHGTYSPRLPFRFFLRAKIRFCLNIKCFYDVATRCLFIRLEVLTQSDTITDSEKI